MRLSRRRLVLQGPRRPPERWPGDGVPRRLRQPGARSEYARRGPDRAAARRPRRRGPAVGHAAAAAEPSPLATEPAQAERELGGRVGLASGGRVAPGGSHQQPLPVPAVEGVDWFEGAASFTYGGGGPACFRDRADVLVCDHGLLAGWRPGSTPRCGAGSAARPGSGRTPGSGSACAWSASPTTTSAGWRCRWWSAPGCGPGSAAGWAIAAEATGEAGLAYLSRGLGPEPQLGLVVAVGVEFRLR